MRLSNHVLFSAPAIGTTLENMAKRIRNETHPEILFMPLMHGSFMFAADLMRQVSRHCLPGLEMDFINVRSYQGTESKQLELVRPSHRPIRGRHVLLIDDILDTGKTMKAVTDYLFDVEQVDFIQIAVLLDKPSRRQVKTMRPDFVGKVIEDKFVVGYGLDYNGHYRELPYIGYLEPEETDGSTA